MKFFILQITSTYHKFSFKLGYYNRREVMNCYLSEIDNGLKGSTVLTYRREKKFTHSIAFERKDLLLLTWIFKRWHILSCPSQLCKFATKMHTECSRKTSKLFIVDCTKFCLRGLYTSQKSQKFPHFPLKLIFYSHHWVKSYHFSQLIWFQGFCSFSHKINFLFTIHTFNHVVYGKQ